MSARRWLPTLLFALVGVAGLAGPAMAQSYPPSQPTSSVSATSVVVGNPDTYCVNNYTPGSTVDVTGGGQTFTVTVNAAGHGCTVFHPSKGCNVYTAGQTSTGAQQAGEPGQSSATVCGVVPQGAPISQATSSLPFTGAVIIPVVIVGVALIGGGVLLLLAGRRRRVRAE
ncbi:MAG: hypothetical protein ACYDB7_07065 [Mycobacteriales bacterium]